MKLYFTNHGANIENEQCISSLDSEIHVIDAKNSKRDRETGIFEIPDIPHNIALHITGNLPGQLKICVGARVMLTYNMNTSDKLINGSGGEIKHIHIIDNKTQLNAIAISNMVYIIFQYCLATIS